jgi:hypothetical protein
MSVTQVDVVQLSNPADREKLAKILRNCSDAMTRAQGEKDYIREAVAQVSKDLNLPKKIVNKMVKVHFKQNFDEEVITNEQFEALYQSVVK